jgi:hypothetical protein
MTSYRLSPKLSGIPVAATCGDNFEVNQLNPGVSGDETGH